MQLLDIRKEVCSNSTIYLHGYESTSHSICNKSSLITKTAWKCDFCNSYPFTKDVFGA